MPHEHASFSMSLRDDINDLLGQARRLRQQAAETALPLYRSMLLNLARQVEERASEMDSDLPDDKNQ